MKKRLLGIQFLTGFLIFLVIAWKATTYLKAERESWILSETKQQGASAARQADSLLKSYTRSILMMGEFKKEKLSWNLIKPFHTITELKVNQGQVKIGNQLSARQAGGISAAQIASAFSELPAFVEGKNTLAYLSVGKDVSGKNLVHMAVRTTFQNWLVLSSEENAFQSLLDQNREENFEQAFLVNSSVVLAHSKPEYISVAMPDHPVASAMIAGEASAPQIYARENDESLYGGFQNIANSNLSVMVTAPESLASVGVVKNIVQWSMVAFGILLVGISLASGLFFGNQTAEKENEHSKLSSNPEETIQKAETSKTEPDFIVEAVDQAVEPAASDSRGIQEVVARMSQEVRAPLLGIIGYAQLLQTQADNQDAKKSAQNLLIDARRMQNTMEQLAAYSGMNTHTKTPVHLKSLVEKVLEVMTSYLKNNEVTVGLHLQEVPVLLANEVQLQKSLHALITNSVEAMARMPNKAIEIRLSHENGQLHLQIQDTGPGIDSEILGRVFDPFYTTKSWSEHSGLGLSMVRGLMGQMSGEVHLRSAAHGGAVAELVIPTEQAVAFAEEKSNDIVIPQNIPVSFDPAPNADMEIDRIIDFKFDDSMDGFDFIESATKTVALTGLGEARSNGELLVKPSFPPPKRKSLGLADFPIDVRPS